ncbi:MAG: exodeoxyribonuclease III [Nanoarchaeota archaeon]
MKLLSWNVNGIRAILGKTFKEFVTEHDPDILCLQETKAHPEQVDHEFLGYHQFWNTAEKKGYAGVAIFSKQKPITTIYGMGIQEHDTEGRVITLEFSDYYLVNVYTPNSQRGLTRLDYRIKWDADFLKFLKKLEHKKPVIFCGDLNVAHQDIDIANPTTNKKNPGFTDEERSNFGLILNSGFIDTFREFNKEPGQYTWWQYMHNCRARNIGWRIDYWCISTTLRPKLKGAFILSKVMGSDHCPVGIVLESVSFK